MPEEQEKLRQVVSGAKHRVSDKLGDIWWWFMVRGVLALGVAVAALFWPQQTIGLLVNLMGAYFLFDGAVGIVRTIRNGTKEKGSLFVIASLVIGAILLFWTEASLRIFLVLVGIWAILQGVEMFLSSRGTDSGKESRQLARIVGAVLAVTGLVLIAWPTTGVVTVSWLISGASLVIGSVLVFVATRLRRISRRMRAAS